MCIAGNPKGKNVDALSFGIFSLGKDKSIWNRFEQPQAGPKGEVQDGLHKRYSSMKDEKLRLIQAIESKKKIIQLYASTKSLKQRRYRFTFFHVVCESYSIAQQLLPARPGPGQNPCLLFDLSLLLQPDAWLPVLQIHQDLWHE